MDIFAFRDQLIGDYASYVKSFIQIRDQRIKEYVDDSLNSGVLWPEPLIQLNPSFESGGTIQNLVGQGVLHSECEHVFRIKANDDDTGRPLHLYKHQTRPS